MPQVLSQHQQNKIAKFKYCGGDSSPVYAYVLSPLAQSLVDITPPWIAPNVITFMGLVFSVISLALSMYYNPDLDKTSCPNWVHLVVAINLFLYQTLDNMDGKQARKTGASSPLGMLFDHGIDAMNACLLVLPLCSALGTGRNMKVVAALGIGMLPFYTTTWEEFYREEMVLGFINGPTEGLLTIMGFLVFTSYYGTESWHKPVTVPFVGQYLVPDGATASDLLGAAFCIMVVCTVVPQLYTAAVEGYQRKGQHPLRTFVTLIPFVVFYGSFFIWTYLSRVALQEYLLITVLFGGSIFVEIVTHVMLAHMCKTPILPAERYTVWLPFILAINVAYNESGHPVVDERFLILPFFVFSFGFTSWKFVQVCHDVADACNIYIFSLEKRSKVK